MSYNSVLFLTIYRIFYILALICYSPLLFYTTWKKRNFSLFWSRLYPNAIRQIEEKKGEYYTIWIHAVSLGETIAMESFVEKIRATKENVIFIFSHITQPGMEISKKKFPFAHAHLYLPFESSILYNRVLKNIEKIDLLLYSEGDIWPLFTHIMRKKCRFIAVINGKLSEKSASRYQLFPAIARALFSHIDFFCLQSHEYKERYTYLGIEEKKMAITGNMKGDRSILRLDCANRERVFQEIGCAETDQLLIIASTHDPEEVEIALALSQSGLIGGYRPIIVPRHPHRFVEVRDAIQKKIPSKTSLLLGESQGKKWDILIIDKMGYLLSLYEVAYIAVVCGSFTQSVGGHNILEPALVGCPFIIGPYIHSQMALYESALQYDALIQVQSITSLISVLERIRDNPELRDIQAKKAVDWAFSTSGATDKTLNFLKKMNVIPF